MKIVIAGGSGQVGQILARSFVARGDEVVILARSTKGEEAKAGRFVKWDGKTLDTWVGEFERADVVVNMAGRSVNCRYGKRNRRAIMNSRVWSTQLVGDAIERVDQPPMLWLQASTATIYAHRFDAGNDEATGVIGGDETGVPSSWKFSIDVAKAWEDAAREGAAGKTRLVLMRSAMTMSPDKGGIFDVLFGLVRWGLGGMSGTGKQYVSWIHDRDFIRAVDWLIAKEGLSGAINVCAPDPVPNAEFMRELREAWGARIGLSSTEWMLRLGAIAMRTETELILKSRRVVPGKLLASGFTFEYPTWSEAARELVERWRKEN